MRQPEKTASIVQPPWDRKVRNRKVQDRKAWNRKGLKERTELSGAAMQEIFQQVAALMVGAIPTALLFIVLVIAYQFLVQGPLSATLRERYARTGGAVDEARRAVAFAEARAAEYAEKLRLARADVYKVREQRIKQWNAERDRALQSAREAAGKKIVEAKTALDAEAGSARQVIQSSAAELAAQVVRAVLPAAAGGPR